MGAGQGVQTCLRQVLDRRLRNVGRKQRRLALLEADLQEEVERVRARYAGRIAACRATVERLRRQVEVFSRDNRNALLPGRRKSLLTDSGVIGFRQTPARVCCRAGHGTGEICRRLRREGLDRFIRIREELDKPAIKKAWQEHAVSEKELARLGIELSESGEEFYLKANVQGALAGVHAA